MAIISKNPHGLVYLETSNTAWVATEFAIRPDVETNATYTINIILASPGVYILNNDQFQIERIIFLCNPKANPTLIATGSQPDETTEERLTFSPSFFLDKLDLIAQDMPHFRRHNPLKTYPKPEKLAVFTRSFNEDIFIQIFIEHYKKLTAPENIYIIDHGSTERSKYLHDNSGVQVIRIPNKRQGETDLHAPRYISYFQRFLLSHYDWVIFVDCDELLVHREGFVALQAMLPLSPPAKIIQAIRGVEIVMDPDTETELDLQRPISLQRHFMCDAPLYAKPVLTSTPAFWSPGFHRNLDEHSIHVCDDLWLIHLKDVSVNEKARRNQLWQTNIQDIWGSATTAEYVQTKESIVQTFRNRIQAGAETMPQWMQGMF
jgi:hypothetical protein